MIHLLKSVLNNESTAAKAALTLEMFTNVERNK